LIVAGTRSYYAKPNEVTRQWLLVDANEAIVGRLASDLAMVLMGKHKPTYTPHTDTGDFVVVVNCEKVVFTGNKLLNKQYSWFTGYTRQRHESAAARLERAPELILREAVRRMLPKNALARHMLDKLKLYRGNQHPHQAQDPQPLDRETLTAIKA
jgi:large subunit ribosomal protein L13